MTLNAQILLAELRELVKSTVRHSPGLIVQDRITAAARMLHLPRSRVEDWYYGEVRRVEAHEAETIREYAFKAREGEIRRMERQIEALRAELAEMAPLGEDRRRAAAPVARRNRPLRRGAAPA